MLHPSHVELPSLPVSTVWMHHCSSSKWDTKLLLKLPIYLTWNFAENCIQIDFSQLEQQSKTVKSRVTEEHQTIWAELMLPLAEWTAGPCTVAEIYSLLEASVQAKLEGTSRTRQFIKRYFAPLKKGGSVDCDCCDKEKLKILKLNTKTLKMVVFVAYTPCLTLVSSIRMWPGFK